MISDWHYLNLARQGDESAWRQLIERYSPQLIRMAFLITGSVDTAKDLAQESFIRLFRQRSKHRLGSFKSYLSTITYRLALKERKQGLRQQSIDNFTLLEKNPGPLEVELNAERDRYLAEIIDSLEEHHRNILVLRFYGNHSYEEIAHIANLPIGTVKSSSGISSLTER